MLELDVSVAEGGTGLGPHTLPCVDGDFSAWHQGCRWCAVWVLPIDNTEVAAAVARARAQLGAAVLPRHARQPHVTVAYRGLCDAPKHPAQEFDAAALQADVQRLHAAQLAPFVLQLAGAGSFETVPYLGVAKDTGCAALHRLHGVLHTPWASAPADHDWQYVPHITVGHYAQRMPLPQALQRMGMRHWQGPRLAIESLALVRYASADIAGPLLPEGTFDLRTQRYTPAPDALWPQVR